MKSLEALNVCLACLTADVEFRASRQSGPSRSLVRWIASHLPLAPAKRFYIHAFEVGHLRNNSSHHPISCQWHPSLELMKPRKRSDSGISSSSEGDLLWHAPDFVTVADIPRLIHEKSPHDIRLRCEHCFSLSPNLSCNLGVSAEGLHLAEFLPQTTNASTDHHRILELEVELAKLRQQLAAIVMVQEQGAAASVDFSYLRPGMTSSPISSGSALQPPPPPPPPPPLLVTPAISIRDIIQKNREKSLTTGRLAPSGNKPNIDMAEILKDMGKIKLRQIARSPGGTPLRPNVDQREANDTASFIANALKKKFAKVLQHSKENQSFSSPDERSSSSSSWSPVTDNNRTPILLK